MCTAARCRLLSRLYRYADHDMHMFKFLEWVAQRAWCLWYVVYVALLCASKHGKVNVSHLMLRHSIAARMLIDGSTSRCQVDDPNAAVPRPAHDDIAVDASEQEQQQAAAEQEQHGNQQALAENVNRETDVEMEQDPGRLEN
jgi:hypothetical protein